MLYTKKDRLTLLIGSFAICFSGGLLLQRIFTYSEIDIWRNMTISLGLSIGVAFNDIFRNMFVKDKSTDETGTLSYLSLLMGIMSLPSFPLVIPSLIGIYYGLPGLKTSKRKIALTGITLSSVGLLLAILLYASCLWAQIKRNSF